MDLSVQHDMQTTPNFNQVTTKFFLHISKQCQGKHYKKFNYGRLAAAANNFYTYLVLVVPFLQTFFLVKVDFVGCNKMGSRCINR